MSSKHRLTRSFRTLSALLYILNIVVSVRFAWQKKYLHILVGVMIALLCLVMLCVAVEAPTPIVARLEASPSACMLFTFRGRYMVDLFIIAYLCSMGLWGILMGFATFSLILSIRFLGIKQPDAFNEIFRQMDLEGQSQADSYTLEGTYDTEGSK